MGKSAKFILSKMGAMKGKKAEGRQRTAHVTTQTTLVGFPKDTTAQTSFFTDSVGTNSTVTSISIFLFTVVLKLQLTNSHLL